MVGIVDRADLLSYLHHPQIGIEVPDLVMSFPHDRVELIAQAKVEGQVSANAPVVLGKQGVGPIAQLPGGISDQHRDFERRTREEVLQLRSVEEISRVAGIGRVPAQECDAAPSISEGAVGYTVPMNLAPEFDRILAGGV